MVFITVPTRQEAKQMALALVEEGLAACVNIIDGMESVYIWEGKLQEDEELLLIAKTTSDKSYELVERVKELHSYDVPSIEVLEVKGGNEDFLQWIRAEMA